ncbi:Glucosamine-6-phosphate isomerase (Glucosamine-6-phosphate deaminase) (GNPDA) (GlcN6P deaminase), partial [Kickxella alabastrina]
MLFMKITVSTIGLLAALPTALAVWPIPQVYEQGSFNSQASRVTIKAKGNIGTIANSAIQRYNTIINNESFTAPVNYNQGVVKTSGTFSGLEVVVADSSDKLDLGTDESYILDIPVNGKATLNANTPYGIVRGLETLSQLVFANGKSKAIHNTPIHIADAPLFPHRGILFDSARNYFSVKSIHRILDAMSFNKMNVLHWHVVDAQSWPIESKTYPELHAKGAYGADMQYSHDDVRGIIQYAKERGIRVIPEFDVPGHTYIVGEAFPELMSCTNKQPNWDHFAAEPPSGQLNIAKPETIEFTKNLFTEYTKLFPDSVFHLGGDEVNRNCWKEDSY